MKTNKKNPKILSTICNNYHFVIETMEIMFGQCFTCPLPKLIDDMTHFLNVTKINDQIDKIQCNITLLFDILIHVKKRMNK